MRASDSMLISRARRRSTSGRCALKEQPSAVSPSDQAARASPSDKGGARIGSMGASAAHRQPPHAMR